MAFSALLEGGHRHEIAQHYPLATLWAEAQLIAARVNTGYSTTAALQYTTIGAVLSGKKGPLDRELKRLRDGG